jgi:hypothetical protein
MLLWRVDMNIDARFRRPDIDRFFAIFYAMFTALVVFPASAAVNAAGSRQ